MIDKVSLSKEWLEEKRIKYAKDPSIIESMIYALYLLEQLTQTELNFIFKGGTSLLLLLEKPARFSVDIDIIVSPTIDKEKLESYLLKISEGSSFVRMELDERRSYKAGVPKAHYKFIYKSNVPTKNKNNEVIENPEREILLDVLFAENPYPVIIDKPIVTEWIKIEGEPLLVKMPCVNSITGDKLTAYAPNTIGVPYQMGKEKEIIKQLFDIATLFELIDDIELVKKSFGLTAVEEIKYRTEKQINIEHVLRDTIETGILLSRREKQLEGDQAKYDELIKGLKQFNDFVFDSNFKIEKALVASARAAYIAVVILHDYKGALNKFTEDIPTEEYLITHPDYNFLNKKLKFVEKGEALFYWNEVLTLLIAAKNK